MFFLQMTKHVTMKSTKNYTHENKDIYSNILMDIMTYSITQ